MGLGILCSATNLNYIGSLFGKHKDERRFGGKVMSIEASMKMVHSW